MHNVGYSSDGHRVLVHHLEARPETALHIFQVLDSGTRLAILAAVAHAPLTVTHLAAALQHDPADVSRQLRMLRACGMVRDEWLKKEHVHAIADASAIRLADGALSIAANARDGSAVLGTCILDADLAQRLRCLDGLAP